MKEQLDDETRTAMVDYRLERARQTLGEADLLRTGDYFNATVNRLYYACYYAASALLLNRHIEANTHNGVKTQLSMHFVRTGLLDLEHSTTFGLLNAIVATMVTLPIVATMVTLPIVTLLWWMCFVRVRKHSLMLWSNW